MLLFLSSHLAALALDAGKETTSNEDWPQWRGPSQNGLATPGQDLPLDWSDSRHLENGNSRRGHGSPIVVGDRVILPTADEQKKTQSVLCLDRSTGELLWTTQIHEGGFMKLNKKGPMPPARRPAMGIVSRQFP